MKKLTTALLCCAAAVTFSVSAAAADTNLTLDELAAQSPFERGPLNSAYARYFDGNSYLKMLSTEQVTVALVTFEPGCRNHWHVHEATKGGGQILIATAGRGYYQEWGKPAQEMKPGDVVNIPANVKHWHGAAPNSAFEHIAIEVDGENTKNTWLEAVDKAEYDALK